MQDWIKNLIYFYVFYITTYILYTSNIVFKAFRRITGLHHITVANIPIVIVVILNVLIFIFFGITGFYFKYTVSFLLWIFVHWLIIKYVIPKYFIFFIPFIPFIIPIPLRETLLNYIPPFKDLTEAGLLPLMEKILFTLISDITIKRKLLNSFDYILEYLKKSIKEIIKIIYPNNNIENEFNKINKVGDNYEPGYPKTNDNDENYEKTIKERANNEYYKNTLDLINLETNNCITNNTILITPDMNLIEKKKINIENEGIKIKCRAESISSYIKANY